MAGLLRKILPVGLSTREADDHEDDNNIEYSFAIEYQGPPVAYDIPRVVPVDVEQLPTATTISSSSLSNDLSLPVVQPIVKVNPIKRKLSKEPKFCSEAKPGNNSSDNNDCDGLPVGSSIWGEGLGVVGCRTGDDQNTKSYDRIGSTVKAESSDGHGSVRESSGRLEVLELGDGSKEGLGLMEYVDIANSDLTGTDSSSRASSSSEVFSCKGEEVALQTPCHVKKNSTVTFRDPELSDIVHGESYYSEPESVLDGPIVTRNGKKGSCYRCLKGNRFTKKEICVVCNAKYCRNCVLRAMGSMPEGRKCVPCIGKRINESNRGALGKCSQLLKHLLSELEIKQIMSSELCCEVNQLPPELVYVNGEPLSAEELFRLQTCPSPPKKLRPGYYWYDKVSGFWGKEGHGPCQIISHDLNVGGVIKPDASNGNTKVFVNNREVTKRELLLLQVSGVQCEGEPHFWVSADGSCQEEGQRNIVGRIWDKTGIRMICKMFYLPVPPGSGNPSGKEASQSTAGLKALHKLLLVGYKKSGTSTIYKQAKILYKVPFSENESQNIKLIIQSNLYGYLGMLLEARERFEKESLLEKRKVQVTDGSGPSGTASSSDSKTEYSIGPRLKAFSDWLLKVMASGNLEVIFPAATREYAPFVEDLLADAAFQATYNRRHELEMLPRGATYFLERATEISRRDYEPSDMDILYAEGITSSNGISCMEFSFPKIEREDFLDSDHQHDPTQRYQLIRLHPSNLGEHCKLVEMFEDVDVVLFCVSLVDCAKFHEDNNRVGTNLMLSSKQLFETIVTHPTFDQKSFHLILNKFDLFEEMVEQGQVCLSQCEWFDDFNPVVSNNRSAGPSLAQRASHYIAVKFKRLFKSLTDRKLFVSVVTALDQDTVDQALRYTREILKWDEDEHILVSNMELSSTDIEASSSS